MYAVINHTFELDIPEPKVKSSQKSVGRWVHRVWNFTDYNQAFLYAIWVIAKDPLLKNDEDWFRFAHDSLSENNFYAIGRESVAITEVSNPEEVDMDKLDSMKPKIHLTN